MKNYSIRKTPSGTEAIKDTNEKKPNEPRSCTKKLRNARRKKISNLMNYEVLYDPSQDTNDVFRKEVNLIYRKNHKTFQKS